jgi:hypothetical protein
VDSDAVYSLLPGKVLDEIGIGAFKEMSFSLPTALGLKENKLCVFG